LGEVKRHRQAPDQALQVGEAFEWPLPLGRHPEEELGPGQKDGPPAGDDLRLQVMLTATLRQAPPAGSQVQDHLGLALRGTSAPWCHRGPSGLRTDCTPLGHLSNSKGPLYSLPYLPNFLIVSHCAKPLRLPDHWVTERP
jgi:hypothetical protein